MRFWNGQTDDSVTVDGQTRRRKQSAAGTDYGDGSNWDDAYKYGGDEDIAKANSQNLLGVGNTALQGQHVQAIPDVRSPLPPPGPGGTIPKSWQDERNDPDWMQSHGATRVPDPWGPGKTGPVDRGEPGVVGPRDDSGNTFDGTPYSASFEGAPAEAWGGANAAGVVSPRPDAGEKVAGQSAALSGPGTFEGAPVEAWGGASAASPAESVASAGGDSSGTFGIGNASSALGGGGASGGGFGTAEYNDAKQIGTEVPGAIAGGPLGWFGMVASELAKHQRENDLRNRAKAGIEAEYAGTQGFPMYGYEAGLAKRRINDQLGGGGISGFIRRLRHGGKGA